MWTKCPDCKKTQNYVPVVSWFITGKIKQCPECKKLDKVARQKWEDEGGPAIDNEIKTLYGQHIYRQPHYQDSQMN